MQIKRLNTKGFTLLEVIIVVMILAISAMLAIPVISSAGSFQLKSAAIRLAADIEYAKNMAVTTGRTHSIHFTIDSAGPDFYTINDANGIITNPFDQRPYKVQFGSDQFSKVQIESAQFDTTQSVSFDYIGSPYNGNNTAMNSGRITLKTDSQKMFVDIEPVTGFIKIVD